jgi:hypothetical protein
VRTLVARGVGVAEQLRIRSGNSTELESPGHLCIVVPDESHWQSRNSPYLAMTFAS